MGCVFNVTTLQIIWFMPTFDALELVHEFVEVKDTCVNPGDIGSPTFQKLYLLYSFLLSIISSHYPP